MNANVVIRSLENGWEVKYPVYGLVGHGHDTIDVQGERYRAFTYDFPGEKTGAWERLAAFLYAELYEIHV